MSINGLLTFGQNGIAYESQFCVDDENTFQIQELPGNPPDPYIYPGDSIKYSLDDELVQLYDTLRDLFFEDTELYYQQLNLLPTWIQDAGQNSDCCVSAEQFSTWINSEIIRQIPDLYKHLHLVACQFWVGTIQNLLLGMEDAFIRFYKTLTTMDTNIGDGFDPDTTVCVKSMDSQIVSSNIESYFIKAYSIMDMVCKIALEIQDKQTDFSCYQKSKHLDVQWGDRKKLNLDGKNGTLFEKCDFMKMIESLRNEIVHNGAWELNPQIYVSYKNGLVAERYVLFPDISQGRLATVKNRKHFFSTGTKMNDVFPKIHGEFRARLLKTVMALNKSNPLSL